MNKSIYEIQKELKELETKKNKLENKLMLIITCAIDEVAKSQVLNRIGEHCILIKFSDLVGQPWNYEFYDWKQSVKVVYQFLNQKHVTEWQSALQNKLDSTPLEKPVIFTFTKGSGVWKTINKVPVSYKFIQEIINQLNKINHE